MCLGEGKQNLKTLREFPPAPSKLTACKWYCNTVLCVLQVSIGERDFVHDEEGPLRGQLDRPRLHGRHPTGEEVHLRRESVLHGIGVRVARRPGRPLLQRHPHGDHAEDLREHRRRKEVGLGSDSQFFSPTDRVVNYLSSFIYPSLCY